MKVVISKLQTKIKLDLPAVNILVKFILPKHGKSWHLSSWAFKNMRTKSVNQKNKWAEKEVMPVHHPASQDLQTWKVITMTMVFLFLYITKSSNYQVLLSTKFLINFHLSTILNNKIFPRQFLDKFCKNLDKSGYILRLFQIFF